MKHHILIILLFVSVNLVGQNSPIVTPLPIDSIGEISEFGTEVYHPILHTKHVWKYTGFSAPAGVDIYSISDGVVTFADYDGGWGNSVEIKLNDSLTVKYAHLAKIIVKENEIVKKGQVIATCGSTGLSTAPHLSLIVKLNDERVNPRDFFNLPKKQ